MFLSEIYGLEASASLSDVTIRDTKYGLLGAYVPLMINGPRRRQFELKLRDPAGLRDAVEGRRLPGPGTTSAAPSARPRQGWQAIFFLIFALIWGCGALWGSVPGLIQDTNVRLHGKMVVGRFIERADPSLPASRSGLVQYEIDGRSYTLTSIMGQGTYTVGAQEKLYYLPADPAGAREANFLPFDLLFAVVGSIMLALAAGLGALRRWYSRLINIQAGRP